MDQTRKQSRIVFDNARPLWWASRRREGRPRTTMQVAVARSRRAVGGASACSTTPSSTPRSECSSGGPSDRSGDQAQVRRNAPRRGVGQVGRLLRRLGGQERNDELPIGRASPSRSARRPTSTAPGEHPDPAASALPGSTTPPDFKRAKSSSCSWGPAYHASCWHDWASSPTCSPTSSWSAATRCSTCASRRPTPVRW